MTPALVFQLASLVALFAWLILALGLVVKPGAAHRVLLLVGGRFAPMLLCAVYLGLLVTYWGSAPGGSFGSLEGVERLFSSRGKLLGGWLHYLAFDLFIGRWMIDDILISKRSRWPLLPCLPLTFMYGPVGLLLYFSLRAWSRQTPNPSVLV